MNLIIRKASVRWKGGARGGTREVTFENDMAKKAKLSLGIPLQKSVETDPAELIAAAHASSFSLALSNELRLKTRVAGEIVTTAIVTAEHLSAGWTIKNIHLNVVATLPKMTQGKFIDAAVRAKINCLVSNSLRANVSMNAKLETDATPRRRRPVII